MPSDPFARPKWRWTRRVSLALLLAPLHLAQAETPSTVDSTLRGVLQKAVAETDSFSDRFEAEVWLMDMSQRLEGRIPDPQRRFELLRHVHYEAHRAELPPELVLAVIEVESNFDRFAISRVGAQGLMQIMPFWLKELDRPEDNLFHLPTNLRFGCTILRYYLDMEDGNLNHALARYNGSLGRLTYPVKVFSALNERWYRR